MKKPLLFLLIATITFSGFAQTKKKAIKKTGTPLPKITYYTAPDSLLLRNQDLKNEPLLYMLFSPDCSHCKHITEELLQNIKHFKKVQILMVTWLPFKDMQEFYKQYHIADYPQITMAWTNDRSILSYYSVHNYPKLISYNKHKKYIASFEGGEFKMEDVWKSFK